ncbi:MAG: MBL fold metallo-hydrolase [Candidatus Lokiarchaeota archaeon]|nr:MBL fold metallo-hydrolase [Candidatus Lokiarchaeota archaeon]
MEKIDKVSDDQNKLNIQDLIVLSTGSLSTELGEKLESMEVYQLGKEHLGKKGDSSVVYIKHDDKHYLVDTGFANEGDTTPKNKEDNKNYLRFILGKIDLTFNDISGVFMTHWHHDHFGNLYLFPNAKLYFYDPDNEIDIKQAAAGYGFDHMLPPIRLKKDDIFAGCRLLPTEGHMRNHCSLLCEFMGFKICIAGDAIVSQSYYDRNEPWPYNAGNLGKKKCIEAMDLIIDVADIIIPGHGHAFQNYRTKNQSA